jgi:PPOX class probable F420-dependent enzyme
MAEDLSGRARELLEQGKNFGHLVTLREDGSPLPVLVWVGVEDDRVAVNSAEGRVWPENLRRTGRATITVTDHDNPYNYVTIDARLVEDTHDGADEHIDRLAKKYMGVDEYPLRKEGEQRIKFLLEPERVRLQVPA